jgi:cell fate regulator YaaT (PSP1 superfamily)
MTVTDLPTDTVRAIGVRFRRAGRLYYYDPEDADIAVGDYAIVETPRGLAATRVVMAATEIDPADLRGDLVPIERPATDADMSSMGAYRDKEAKAEQEFANAITSHNLPMQAVKAEYTFDGATLTLHFSSKEAKLELADMVTKLASKFRTRVELRQVGPRERAAMRSGMGRCGRDLCCATFLSELDTVSLRMARDQNLPLNPDKISGVCGRLLCCLQYEHDGYVQDKLDEERASGGGGCATTGKCESCGVHELKDVLGQAVAPGYETESEFKTLVDTENMSSQDNRDISEPYQDAERLGSSDTDRPRTSPTQTTEPAQDSGSRRRRRRNRRRRRENSGPTTGTTSSNQPN